MAAAGLQHADIDVVLRTGGSSRYPAFVRMLAEKFGAERLQEMDVFTGVASGLAIAASRAELAPDPPLAPGATPGPRSAAIQNRNVRILVVGTGGGYRRGRY